MFRSTVTCTGLTESEAAEAVADMLFEFSERPWQQNVTCEWKGGVLRLTAESDVDSQGLALLDEFRTPWSLTSNVRATCTSRLNRLPRFEYRHPTVNFGSRYASRPCANIAQLPMDQERGELWLTK
jgi:hypothetical protein